MPEPTTPRGRIVAAALGLAAQRPWSEITLLDIAEAAGIGLAEMRTHFGGKSQIVAAFMREIDDAVLRQASTRTQGQSRRDALFDVVMSRFDALMPHKAALKSIAAAGTADPALFWPFLNAQRWMLAAAGIDGDGAGGLVRTAGLASVYATVFRTWLADDDTGMARTMAALDRRLRRGESTLATVEGACRGALNLATTIPAVIRGAVFGSRRRQPAAAADGDADAGTDPGSGDPAADRPAA